MLRLVTVALVIGVLAGCTGAAPTTAPTESSTFSPPPAPTTTPRPTATLEPAEPTPAPLPEGPFVLVNEMLFGVRTTVDIPAPDWHGMQYYTGLEKRGKTGPPDGAKLVVYGGNLLVYRGSLRVGVDHTGRLGRVAR